MPNMTIKANISSRVRIGGTGLPVLLPKPVGVISGPSVDVYKRQLVTLW